MSYLIDVAILLLLVGTLAYAYLVDRRVKALMAVLKDMGPVVGQFSEAVDKSENSVSMLRSMAEKVRNPIHVPSPAPAQDSAQVVSFRTSREKTRKPAGVTKVSGKSDLVRGFFDAARTRGV